MSNNREIYCISCEVYMHVKSPCGTFECPKCKAKGFLDKQSTENYSNYWEIPEWSDNS